MDIEGITLKCDSDLDKNESRALLFVVGPVVTWSIRQRYTRRFRGLDSFLDRLVTSLTPLLPAALIN